MKPVEREIIFDRFLVAIGIRQVWQDVYNDKSWEVYCRIASGSDVVVATDCTEEEATTILNYKTAEASFGGAASFIVTEDNAMVDADFIVRIYVDKHVNQFICGIEDVTGKHYTVSKGTEEDCQALCHNLAHDIMARLNLTRGGGNASYDEQLAE